MEQKPMLLELAMQQMAQATARSLAPQTEPGLAQSPPFGVAEDRLFRVFQVRSSICLMLLCGVQG
jgi:hypothetical protein